MQASTTYDPGAVTAKTSGHGESFLSPDQLRQLIALRLRQNAAAAAPVAARGGAARGSAGTGPILRRTEYPGPEYSQADLEAAGRGHSWVQNMGGPQQVGGFVRTGFGPRAVYGGHDPTYGAGGPVTIQGGGESWSPAIDWDFEDPQERQARATAGLPGNAARHDMSRRLAIANMLRRSDAKGA